LPKICAILVILVGNTGASRQRERERERERERGRERERERERARARARGHLPLMKFHTLVFCGRLPDLFAI
jgi:hypothetical protein